jgi:hypothetical protein
VYVCRYCVRTALWVNAPLTHRLLALDALVSSLRRSSAALLSARRSFAVMSLPFALLRVGASALGIDADEFEFESHDESADADSALAASEYTLAEAAMPPIDQTLIEQIIIWIILHPEEVRKREKDARARTGVSGGDRACCAVPSRPASLADAALECAPDVCSLHCFHALVLMPLSSSSSVAP